jgi:hypothetical protein
VGKEEKKKITGFVPLSKYFYSIHGNNGRMNHTSV